MISQWSRLLWSFIYHFNDFSSKNGAKHQTWSSRSSSRWDEFLFFFVWYHCELNIFWFWTSSWFFPLVSMKLWFFLWARNQQEKCDSNVQTFIQDIQLLILGEWVECSDMFSILTSLQRAVLPLVVMPLLPLAAAYQATALCFCWVTKSRVFCAVFWWSLISVWFILLPHHPSSPDLPLLPCSEVGNLRCQQ